MTALEEIEAFKRQLEAAGLSLSNPRSHQAMDAYKNGAFAADCIAVAEKQEASARQSWLETAVDPWCQRHGITREQALSIAFDDGAFNPANPKKDQVTLRDLFAWGGQQNDFAMRVRKDARMKTAGDSSPNDAMYARIRQFISSELGTAAPVAGSKLYEDLATRLVQAVEATRTDRVELFTPELRARLQQTYINNERDNGNYDKSWCHYVALNGVQAITDQTDEALLERVLQFVHVDFLRDDAGVWVAPHGEEFFSVMCAQEALSIVKNLVEWDSEMLNDTLIALKAGMDAKGIANPFLEFIQEDVEVEANQNS